MDTLHFSKKLISSQSIVSRLAPTPSGYLHLGNAFSFILTWLLVRRLGGKLHLRIDDLDAPRLNQDCLEDIFIQLEWLGLDYDTGPQGPDDHLRHFSQSLRLEEYMSALKEIRESELLYACSCSRKQYLPKSKNGLYPGICREKKLDFDQPGMAWRFRSETKKSPDDTDLIEGSQEENQFPFLGDAIMRRKDGLPSYQIASLVDDLKNQCSLIVRGMDLFPSTHFQISVAEKMAWQEFNEIMFVHHPLLKDSFGKKLSKSEAALSLKTLRKEKSEPVCIYRGVARSLDLPVDEIEDLKSLQKIFTSIPLEKLNYRKLKDLAVF